MSNSPYVAKRLSEAVHLRLSETDRFNLRVIVQYLAHTKIMPGSLSLSSAMRWTLSEVASQILDGARRTL